MNTTKKHLTLVLLGMIIVLPLITTSCFKKGSEDPFFSIYTRKARVTGEWTISSLTWDIKSDDGIEELRTQTSVTGTTWHRDIQIVGTDSIRELEGTVTEGRNKIIFYEDGRFTETYEYEYSEEIAISDEESEITITKVQETMDGKWNFLHNIDDYKTKERIALVVENSNAKTFVYKLEIGEEVEEGGTPVPTLDSTYANAYAYSNGEYSTIWTLRMLKNKQIIMDQDIDGFSVTTINNQGNSYTEVGFKTQTLTRE